MKNNLPPPHPVSLSAPRAAFSLVELLVVLAVVAILGVVAVVGFSSINRGAGARGAADLAASMALSARVEALSMGAGALLVVDAGSSPDNRWRRLAVFRRAPDPNNASATLLQMVGQPVRLQGNTHFLRAYSRGFVSTNVDFPGAANAPVLAYEFTGTGHLNKPPADQDIRFVFGPGPVDSGGRPVNESLAANRSGFVLRPNGRPTFFTSPEEMPEVN